MFGCCIKMKPGEGGCCEGADKEREFTVILKVKCTPEEGCCIEAEPVKSPEEKS